MISLINFIVNNQENFRTYTFVYSINTRNKHYPHRQTTKHPCLQESAFVAGIKLFGTFCIEDYAESAEKFDLGKTEKNLQ